MDHFKAVNDEYDHDIGDKILKELTTILKENVIESDILIRYEGKEFIVLIVGIKIDEDVINVTKKVGTNVRENEIDVYAGDKLKNSVNLSFSIFPQDKKSLNVVLKNINITLYEVKSE